MLVKELQALCLDVRVLDEAGEDVDISGLYDDDTPQFASIEDVNRSVDSKDEQTEDDEDADDEYSYDDESYDSDDYDDEISDVIDDEIARDGDDVYDEGYED